MGSNPSKASNDDGSFIRYNNASTAERDEETPYLNNSINEPKNVKFIHTKDPTTWRSIEYAFENLGIELGKGNIVEGFDAFLKTIYKERSKLSKTKSNLDRLDTTAIREVMRELDAATATKFLTAVPKLKQLANDLPVLISQLPLLNQNDGASVVLSKAACASLLLNAFCGSVLDPGDYCYLLASQFHSQFNFFEWFGNRRCKPYLKALLNYFIRIGNESPANLERKMVSFQRSSCANIVLDNARKELKRVTAFHTGAIEDSNAILHAAFSSSPLIGGDVLQGRRAQAEILLCMRPELLCGIAFCAAMKADEAIIVRGAERYSSFTGQGEELEFSGDYIDETPCDSGYLQREIAFYDAVLVDQSGDNQFADEPIRRDILKAYAAFKPAHELKGDIATGNWGCGYTRNNKDLKFLEQYIAASMAGRDVQYYTFGDKEFSDRISGFVSKLEQGSNVWYANDLLRALCTVCRTLNPKSTNINLLEQVAAVLAQQPQQSASAS